MVVLTGLKTAEIFVTNTHSPVQYLELFFVPARPYIVDWLSQWDVGSKEHSWHPKHLKQTRN
jgi:hypothetical protein